MVDGILRFPFFRRDSKNEKMAVAIRNKHGIHSAIFKMKLSDLFRNFTNHLMNLVTVTNDGRPNMKKCHLSLCWMEKEIIIEIAKLKIGLLSFIDAVDSIKREDLFDKEYEDCLNGLEYSAEVSCCPKYNTRPPDADVDVNVTQGSYSNVPETDLESDSESDVMPPTPQSAIVDSMDESSNFSSEDQYASDADKEMDSSDDVGPAVGMTDLELENVKEIESMAVPLSPRLDVMLNTLDGIEIPEQIIEVEVGTSPPDGLPKKSDDISGRLKCGCCMYADDGSERIVPVPHFDSESESDDDVPIRGRRCDTNGSCRIIRMIKNDNLTHDFSSKNISSQPHGFNSGAMSGSSGNGIKAVGKMGRRKSGLIKY